MSSSWEPNYHLFNLIIIYQSKNCLTSIWTVISRPPNLSPSLTPHQPNCWLRNWEKGEKIPTSHFYNAFFCCLDVDNKFSNSEISLCPQQKCNPISQTESRAVTQLYPSNNNNHFGQQAWGIECMFIPMFWFCFALAHNFFKKNLTLLLLR